MIHFLSHTGEYITIQEADRIDEQDVGTARAAGALIHHEVEYEVNYNDEDMQWIRDDWYAATPEWVERYHKHGGCWGYRS